MKKLINNSSKRNTGSSVRDVLTRQSAIVLIIVNNFTKELSLREIYIIQYTVESVLNLPTIIFLYIMALSSIVNVVLQVITVHKCGVSILGEMANPPGI